MTDIRVSINFDAEGETPTSIRIFKNDKLLIGTDQQDLSAALRWLIIAFRHPLNAEILGKQASEITFAVESKEPLLSGREFEAMHQVAEIWEALNLVVGEGPSREADLAELAIHVHAIQNAILAQASAREYPDNFRLLGEVIERTSER